MYRIFLERGAENDLNALDDPLRKRILERLFALGRIPRPQGAKKLVGMPLAWRIRVGDWRILYEVDDKQKAVKVYRIKHRSRVY